jgi:hypothetical protein
MKINDLDITRLEINSLKTYIDQQLVKHVVKLYKIKDSTEKLKVCIFVLFCFFWGGGGGLRGWRYYLRPMGGERREEGCW